MAAFKFTSPEGKTYTVNGPDGATKEQAFAMLQSHLGAPPPATPAAPPPAPAAAPATPAAAPSPLMAPVGGAEMLASGLTGALSRIPAGLAGLGAGAINTGAEALGGKAPLPAAADVVHNTENALTYHPLSDSGKAGQQYLGEKVAPVVHGASKLLGKAGNAVGGETGANVAQNLIPALGDAIASVTPLAGALGAARGVGGIVEGAAKPAVGVGTDAIESGRGAGFKFTPGAVESRNPAMAGELPSSSAVTPADRRAINLHNQALITQLAGEQIGVPGAKGLSPKDYDAARVPHFDTYTQTGQDMGSGLTGSPAFVSNLESRLADSTQTALKGEAAAQTQRILNAAKTGNLSGPQIIKDISWLRQNKGASVARMLEDEVQTQLAGSNPQQLDKFRAARTGLAQINNLQDATAGGQVNASKLAALDADNPGMLTGNLKLIAQTAAAAPQDFRLPSGVVPGSSPLSKPTVLSVAKNVINSTKKTVLPGRFDAQSDAFQNRFGREATPTEKSYGPDLGKRPEKPSEPFALAAPPGAAGGVSQRELSLPQGPAARPPAPNLALAPPEGEVGINPSQLGLQIAGGGPRAPQLDLAAAPGEIGEAPSRQLGMEIAQGRPLDEQRLGLKPTDGALEPHQPSLLGHEGTPEGGSRAPKKKDKKRGKD